MSLISVLGYIIGHAPHEQRLGSHQFYIQVDKDPTVIFKVKDEMKTICSHYGLPRKINMFDGHPKGIVSVAFAKAEGKF